MEQAILWDIPEDDGYHPGEILSKNISGGQSEKQGKSGVEVSIKYIKTRDGGL